MIKSNDACVDEVERVSLIACILVELTLITH